MTEQAALTLARRDGAKWTREILGYYEECLAPHMKILILKWGDITTAQFKHVDDKGYLHIGIQYLAVCCGCHYRTMARTIKDMCSLGYMHKNTHWKRESSNRAISLKMDDCVWNAQFKPIPQRNKGKGQKKFFCHTCGSHDVEAVAKKYQVICHECGSVEYQDRKGKLLDR